MAKHERFPTFAVILLAAGVLLLLSDLHIITWTVPWWPLILIAIGLGMLINNYWKEWT